MSNSNGYNPSSLLALERSLRGNPPASDPAESVSARVPELSEEPEDDQPASRALNWDEAIGLTYEDEQSPEAEAMTWEDGEDRSQGFGLEDNEAPIYNVQAFAVEEKASSTDNPLSHSNSLFALEQSVYGVLPIAPTVESFSVEEPELEQSRPTIESQSFDWNEAIALEYEGDPELSAQSEAHAFDWDEAISLECGEAEHPPAKSFDWMPDEEPPHSTAESFEWLPTDEGSYGLGLEDEPLTFTVEAFAVEDGPPPAQQTEDSEAKSFETEAFEARAELKTTFGATDEVSNSVKKAAEPSHTYDLEPDDDDVSIANSQAYSDSEAIPVEATIVNPANPRQKPAAPIDFDELEQSIAASHDSEHESADAQAFAADIAAILRGEKIYEPAAAPFPETTVLPPQAAPTPQLPIPAPTAPPAQSQLLSSQPPSAHEIFDQMGRSMTHATAFDLGTISLQQTFDEFDAILDEQENALSFSDGDEERVDPETHTVPAIAQPFEWDEDELAADVTALRLDQPFSTSSDGEAASDAEVGTTLSFDFANSMSSQEDELALELSGSWEVVKIDDENQEVEVKQKRLK